MVGITIKLFERRYWEWGWIIGAGDGASRFFALLAMSVTTGVVATQ